jgi:hypothetical protein
MEVMVGVIATLLTLVLLFNTFLLIGIARFLVKLVKYIGPEEEDDREKWSKIIRQRRILQMQEANQATYADTVGLKAVQEAEARGPRGWDGIPRVNRNWDGIPKIEDEE